MSTYFTEKDKALSVINSLVDVNNWKDVWNSSNISKDGNKLDDGALTLSNTISTTNAFANGSVDAIDIRSSAWLITTINAYSEQPNIIRSVIKDLVTPIMNCIDQLTTLILANQNSQTIIDSTDAIQHVHCLCKLLYVICKVAGFKHVMKVFPHEVIHLEKCYIYMLQQNANEFENWETRYIFLLWLGMIA